jgi:uncharacterized protein YciI
MQQFLIKLIPPRKTFADDMTPDEQALMHKHFLYWKDLCDKGTAIVVGPVFDPKEGAWGLGIVDVETEADAHAIGSNDPVVLGGVLTFEIAPMRAALIRKSS